MVTCSLSHKVEESRKHTPHITTTTIANENATTNDNNNNTAAASTITTSTNDTEQISSTSPLPQQQMQKQQGRVRYCYSCQQPCSRSDKSLIRALGNVYHYNCFTCEDCNVLVADKFYALNTNIDTDQLKVVCELHYYNPVKTPLCSHCQQPSLHQRCQCQSKCPDCTSSSSSTTRTDDDAYFEFNGQIYCLLHFSAIKDIQCAGCQQAVLKQFVEHKSHPGKKWHPECYMIFKFWNVRLADTLPSDGNEKLPIVRLKEIQATMERKVNRIWTDLSSFEESSATCISDMLLLVAAGAYVEGFRMASQFVMHLEVLFNALEDTQQQPAIIREKVIPCGKESKTICNQVIRFFYLLTRPDDKKLENDLGITQELLCLVTSLAQNLKTLIRIGLTEALFLERDCHVADAIPRFLNNLLELERKRVWIGGRYWFKEDPFPKLLNSAAPAVAPTASLSPTKTATVCCPSSSSSSTSSSSVLGKDRHYQQQHDQCHSCRLTIDTDCYQYGNHECWHPSCFVCSKCQRSLSKDLLTARFAYDTTSGTRVLVCDQCIASNRCFYPHHHDMASSFTHLPQLQHYLYLLKLALARLYFVINPSSDMTLEKDCGLHEEGEGSKKTTISHPVTFLRMNNEVNPIHHHYSTDGHHPYQQQQQRKQKQQKHNHRRSSFFGSVHFGNIKRAKSTHLDRINEHPQGNCSSTNVSNITPPSIKSTAISPSNPSKRAFSVHEQYRLPRPTSVEVSSTKLPVHKAINNSDLNHQPSVFSTVSAGSGVFSATRRASTSTLQRMGSLRRVLGQRRGADRGSIYSVFDRRHSQKQQQQQQQQQPQQPQQPRQQQETNIEFSSSISDILSESPTEVNELRIATALPSASIRTRSRSSSLSSTTSSSVVPGSASVPTSLETSPRVHRPLLQLSPSQYFVVRHVAAKTMASILPDLFSMEEWLFLVECKKPTLWGKLKTRIRTSQASMNHHHQLSQQHAHQTKVFGVPLSSLVSTCRYDLSKQHQQQHANMLKNFIATNKYLDNQMKSKLQSDRHFSNDDIIDRMVLWFTSSYCKVPFFVQHCILSLLHRDLSVEGIFRKNGNIRELKQIEDMIDKDTTTQNRATVDILSQQSSIQLAALLKRYLRELPEPLLTFNLYPVFVAAIGLETEEEIKNALHLACCMLPKENRDTMQVILSFLQYVSTFKDLNKMGIGNLARIMAPSILYDRQEYNQHHYYHNQQQQQHPSNQDSSATVPTATGSSILTDRTPNDEIRVVEKLIQYHDQFDNVPSKMVPLLSNAQMVEWLAATDSKHFVKRYTDLLQPGFNHPTLQYPYHHPQRSSVPTLSTTVNDSDAALSLAISINQSQQPLAVAGQRSSPSKSSTARSQPASPVSIKPSSAFFNFIPEPSTTTASLPKTLNRRSWILRK